MPTAIAESYVKLLDFGIGQAAHPARTNVTHAHAGHAAVHVPSSGLGRLWTRARHLRAGVILYRIFSGQYPFTGTVITELVYQHVADAPARPRATAICRPDWSAFILDCLAKDPRPGRKCAPAWRTLEARSTPVRKPARAHGSRLALLSATVPAVAHSSPPMARAALAMALPDGEASPAGCWTGRGVLVTGAVFARA